MTIAYDDIRYGDRYEIDLDDQGNFLSAVRFVEGIGRDPIHYNHINAIPEPHKNEIEHLIWLKRYPGKK